MTGSELFVRCLKARIVSWLNSDKVGATLPLSDGNHVLLAVYDNGRYVKPERVEVPNSLEGWGLDGPATYNQPQPPEEGEEEDSE